MWIRRFCIISLSLWLSACCVAGVETYYTCEIALPEPFNPRTQRHELFKGLNAKLARDSRSPQALAQELARSVCYAHLGPSPLWAGAYTLDPALARAQATKQNALILAHTLGFERCIAQVMVLPHTCQAHKTINPIKHLEFTPALH